MLQINKQCIAISSMHFWKMVQWDYY